MTREAIGSRGRRPRGRAPRRAYSLVEALVVMVIMSVLVAMGIPRFQRSLEQARADVAGATLRAIWSAQRLYWLQNRSFAPDLQTLQSANLIDPSLPTATAPYSYQVTASGDSTFTATATRSGSSFWSGSFTIAADGTFTGSVQLAGQGPLIVPSYQ